MSDNQDINDRVKLAMAKSNVSQRELARQMGLSSPTVSAMLSKKIDSIKYIEAISKATGYSFEWLRTGEGEGYKVEEEKAPVVSEPAGVYSELVKTQRDLITCMKEKEQVQRELDGLKKFSPTEEHAN